MNKGPIWDADLYDRYGRFVSDHGDIILNWLAAKSGETILDAGCGDGALTQKIAESGAKVLGIERAASMAKAAQARGLDVRQMDLCTLEDEDQYQAIFSNAVLHWIADWPDLLSRFHKALKSDGRLVVECGGFGNIAAIRTAIMAVAKNYQVPTHAAAEQYLTIQRATNLLQQAGFQVTRIELAPRQTFLPNGMAGWLEVFREPFLAQFDQQQKDQVMADILELLTNQLKTPEGEWFADYVRLRFVAKKEDFSLS